MTGKRRSKITLPAAGTDGLTGHGCTHVRKEADMLEAYINNFYGLLLTYLPSGWKKMAFLGRVKPGFYDFVFYVKEEGSDKYRQCFVLARDGVIDGAGLRKAFADIYELCLKAQRQMEEGQRIWRSFTLLLDNEGNFSIDYSYEEPAPGVPDAWKERYLK